MKNIVFLETAEDVLFAFSPTRMQGDKFPYVGNDAKLTVDDQYYPEIIDSDIDFQISKKVTMVEIIFLLVQRSGIDVVLPPHVIFDVMRDE